MGRVDFEGELCSLGGRVLGVQSAVTWGAEAGRERQLCEFSGCEGYLEGEYHRHLTKHFRQLLAKDMEREKELMGLKFPPQTLSSPLCLQVTI